MYLQHRNPADVINEDLSSFPLSLGTFVVNEKDSSVTGSVWGFAKRKTIYRKGFGCTLIQGITEEEIRSQPVDIPDKPAINTENIAWPNGDKLPDTIAASFSRVKLNNAVDSVLQEKMQKGTQLIHGL